MGFTQSESIKNPVVHEFEIKEFDFDPYGDYASNYGENSISLYYDWLYTLPKELAEEDGGEPLTPEDMKAILNGMEFNPEDVKSVTVYELDEIGLKDKFGGFTFVEAFDGEKNLLGRYIQLLVPLACK